MRYPKLENKQRMVVSNAMEQQGYSLDEIRWVYQKLDKESLTTIYHNISNGLPVFRPSPAFLMEIKEKNKKYFPAPPYAFDAAKAKESPQYQDKQTKTREPYRFHMERNHLECLFEQSLIQKKPIPHLVRIAIKRFLTDCGYVFS